MVLSEQKKRFYAAKLGIAKLAEMLRPMQISESRLALFHRQVIARSRDKTIGQIKPFIALL